MPISADSQAVLLLCSQLGLPPNSDPTPLPLREWNVLAPKIHASPLKRPGALLEASSTHLEGVLEISADQAERMRRLLDRGTALAVELDRLESLGIWVVTRADDAYPVRLRERLRGSAPAALFGAGPISLVGQTGLAVVGSRNVDVVVSSTAQWVGAACAKSGLVVYSGGARGVDGRAMGSALESGGRAVGVLADSLERAIRIPDNRAGLADEVLTLLTSYHPKAGFSVGTAMARNKIIYTLSDYGLVVASDAETGGTWAGATEALKAGWVPLFACDGAEFPEGNRLLVQRGAVPLPMPFPGSKDQFAEWLASSSERPNLAGSLKQRTLF